MQGICLTAYHTQVDPCICPERITLVFNDDWLNKNYFFRKKKYSRTSRNNLPEWSLTFKFAHPKWQATVDISNIIRVFPGYLLIYTCMMLMIACSHEWFNIKLRRLYNGVAYHVEITRLITRSTCTRIWKEI